MTFERWLSGVTAAEFLGEHFNRFPSAKVGHAQTFAGVGGWDVVGRLLANPDADVVVGNPDGSLDESRPQTVEQARSLLADGKTVGVRHAHAHDAQLRCLAADFHRTFAAPIDVHLYCTGAGKGGFGWHYDPEDVFILQSQGSKEWLLRKNTVNPWPILETMPSDLRYEREIMPLLRCTLTEGCWLYIPAGYWHRTSAVTESISLSVGIKSATGLDVLDFLRPRLLESLVWRERLPPAGEASVQDDQALMAAYRERCQRLAEDVTNQLTSETFIKSLLDHARRNPASVAEVARSIRGNL